MLVLSPPVLVVMVHSRVLVQPVLVALRVQQQVGSRTDLLVAVLVDLQVVLQVLELIALGAVQWALLQMPFGSP